MITVHPSLRERVLRALCTGPDPAATANVVLNTIPPLAWFVASTSPAHDGLNGIVVGLLTAAALAALVAVSYPLNRLHRAISRWRTRRRTRHPAEPTVAVVIQPRSTTAYDSPAWIAGDPQGE